MFPFAEESVCVGDGWQELGWVFPGPLGVLAILKCVPDTTCNLVLMERDWSNLESVQKYPSIKKKYGSPNKDIIALQMPFKTKISGITFRNRKIAE